MRNKFKTACILIFFALTTICLLCFPQKALSLSLEALDLWFDKMIPALLPFMILSGMLIRMNLSDYFASFFSPLLKPAFKLPNSCLYCIAIGFLCGFPMGARVCAESLQHKKINIKEAQLLLGFCNNIGPVYMTGYVLSLFPTQNTAAVLLGMYGIPLLYGLILRYTVYRNLQTGIPEVSMNSEDCSVFAALNQSIISALDAITVLGGYMIFCNLLNLFPAMILQDHPAAHMAGAFLEITSGLARMSDAPVWIAYALLTFGGLSCIAQTSSCIRNTDLSLKRYVLDKMIQTALSILYYRAVFG